MDYRSSKFYQFTLRTCTGIGQTSDVGTYLHRQFFGIGDDQFQGEYDYPLLKSAHWLQWPDINHRDTGYYRRVDHYGKVPIDEFLTLENETFADHQPGMLDMVLVQDYLYRKGLPAELVLEVMDLASYRPVGRLSKPHDPLHTSNRQELTRYLTYCWRLLVYCDMIAKALDMELPWKELIGNCITDFWADECCGKGRFFWYSVNEYGDSLPKVFIKP
jgi:hypothetical protein